MTAEITTRRSPLQEWTAQFDALPAAVRLRELPFITQLNLRVDPTGPAGAATAAVLGTPLPTEPGTATRVGDIEVLWLGPDEWLVLAPQGSAALQDTLSTAVSGHGAVIDVSAQRTTLHLAGPRARDLLAHGCSIDLHPAVARQGKCVTTLLALAGVTLVVHSDTADDYWILVRSSFADYLAGWLVDACAEYRDDPQWL